MNRTFLQTRKKEFARNEVPAQTESEPGLVSVALKGYIWPWIECKRSEENVEHLHIGAREASYRRVTGDADCAMCKVDHPRDRSRARLMVT